MNEEMELLLTKTNLILEDLQDLINTCENIGGYGSLYLSEAFKTMSRLKLILEFNKFEYEK